MHIIKMWAEIVALSTWSLVGLISYVSSMEPPEPTYYEKFNRDLERRVAQIEEQKRDESKDRWSSDAERKRAADLLPRQLKVLCRRYGLKLDHEQVGLEVEAIRMGDPHTRGAMGAYSGCHLNLAVFALAHTWRWNQDDVELLDALYECLFWKELLFFRMSPIMHKEPSDHCDGLRSHIREWRREKNDRLVAEVNAYISERWDDMEHSGTLRQIFG